MSKPPFIFINIDYDEFDPSSYRSVDVMIDGQDVEVFCTGDVVADHRAALVYALAYKPISIASSSSVGDFVADSNGAYTLRPRLLGAVKPYRTGRTGRYQAMLYCIEEN